MEKIVIEAYQAEQRESDKEVEGLKEKAARAVNLFQAMAEQKKITLKLRRKPGKGINKLEVQECS